MLKSIDLLRPNLDTKGRVIRGIGALALALAAFLLWSRSRTAAIALGASSAFVAIESWRGWCALRACGLKTKY
jgi:hypothetical protein